MKSPESYKKEYPKSAKEKFAIPRNKDGEPNPEVFEITKDVVKKLSKYPSFVGAAPYGSKMKGYSKGGSDLDVALFVDDGDTDSIIEQNTELNNLLHDAFEVTNKHGGHDAVHTEHYRITEETIQHAITNHNSASFLTVAQFFGMVSGPKVDIYRKIISEKVNTLSGEKRKAFISDVITEMVTNDNSRRSEIEDRIPNTKGVDLIKARSDLWEKRINDILAKQYE